MDQTSRNSESSPFKLPEVQPRPDDNIPNFEGGRNSGAENATSKAIETNSSNASSTINAPTSVPISVDPSIIDNNLSSIQTSSTPKKIAITDNLSANDVELIEKAWVLKAKAIVDQTRNDPHEQTAELSKIREDYQSKRFKTNFKIDKD